MLLVVNEPVGIGLAPTPHPASNAGKDAISSEAAVRLHVVTMKSPFPVHDEARLAQPAVLPLQIGATRCGFATRTVLENGSALIALVMPHLEFEASPNGSLPVAQGQ